MSGGDTGLTPGDDLQGVAYKKDCKPQFFESFGGYRISGLFSLESSYPTRISTSRLCLNFGRGTFSGRLQMNHL